jgi:hypothetical protein
VSFQIGDRVIASSVTDRAYGLEPIVGIVSSIDNESSYAIYEVEGPAGIGWYVAEDITFDKPLTQLTQESQEFSTKGYQ